MPERACNVCGDYEGALVHTDAELDPNDAADGYVLHTFEAMPDE